MTETLSYLMAERNERSRRGTRLAGSTTSMGNAKVQPSSKGCGYEGCRPFLCVDRREARLRWGWYMCGEMGARRCVLRTERVL
jgi:hypothetical protein